LRPPVAGRRSQRRHGSWGQGYIWPYPIWMTETGGYIPSYHPKLITGGGLVGAGGTFNPILRDRFGQAESHQGEKEDDDPDKRHPLIGGEQAEDRQPDNEAYPHKRVSFSRVEGAERGRGAGHGRDGQPEYVLMVVPALGPEVDLGQPCFV
jgi:hypothetical protein